MASLQELFDSRSQASAQTLMVRLQARAEPAAAAALAGEALDAVRVAYLAQDGLSPSAQRLAPLLVETIKEGMRLPASVTVHQEQPGWRAVAARGRRFGDLGLAAAAAAGLALLLLTVLVLAGNLLGSLILLLLAVAVGAALFSAPPSRSDRPPPAPTLGVRPEAWIDSLRASLHAADRVIAEAEAAARPVHPSGQGLAANPDLLETIQDLLEAAQARDGGFALQKIGYRIPRLLKKEGISAVTFDGSNDQLFDFETTLAPGGHDPRTVRPALVQGDRCLKAGRAERPASGAGAA